MKNPSAGPVKALGAALAIAMIAACGSPAPASDGSGAPGNGDQGAAAERANDVRVAITFDTDNRLDPTTGWGHGTAPLIHSTLVELNSDMGIENDLATGYDISDDRRTYTFHMRDDAFFTDGEPVTAADVEFTYRTALEKGAQELSHLEDVRAVGDHEVVFTLDAPNSSFINTVALVGIVAEHDYDEDDAGAPIGSGPWVLAQWNEGEQIILERNEDYYGKALVLDGVTILIMTEDAAFAAARAGEVDVAITSATLATQDIDGMRLEVVKTLDGRGVTLPMLPDEGKTTEDGDPIGNDVTSNPVIRHAMAIAVDREEIAEVALNGYATPAYTENDGTPWSNPESAVEYDLEAATQMLAEDGWDPGADGILEKDGLRAEFSAYYPADDSDRQAIGLAAAGQLEEIGIRMNVEGKSWDEIAANMFSSGVIMGWGSADPYISYQLYHSSGGLKDDFYNPGGFADPAVDEYLEAALQAQTPAEANEQWQLAQWDGATGTSMRGGAPWLWLVNPDHLYYVAEDLSIGTQQLHGHGASWELMQNLKDWSWD